MPFLGNLEDIPMVDVLQLLCVAKKSGLLTVEGPDATASLVLRDGEITGAHHPSPGIHVGTVLIEMGVVGRAEIEQALQQCATSGTPIVSTLVHIGRITREQGWTALARLVERTVAVMAEWKRGRFSFDQREQEISDDFRYRLAAVEEAVGGIDGQHVLMEVLRVFDERNRAQSADSQDEPAEPSPSVEKAAPPPQSDVQPAASSPETTPPHVTRQEASREGAAPDPQPGDVGKPNEAVAHSRPPEPDTTPATPRPAARAHTSRARSPSGARQGILYSQDGLLRNLVGATCEQYGITIHVPATEHHLMTRIQLCLTEPHAPPLVIDVSNQQDGPVVSNRQLLLVERIKRRFPMLPIVVLGPYCRDGYLRAFELGARGYLPRVRGKSSDDITARTRTVIQLVAACVDGYLRERESLCDELALARREMALLRHRVLQMTAPGASPDISLLLLEHVADYLDRCVIFVIRPADLIGLGAFGLGHNSETMSALVAGLKIPLDVPSLSRTVIEDRTIYRGRIEDEVLQTHLFAKIGASTSSEGLLLPLIGPERPIALIYADHGNQEPRPFATDPLEVLASVAGLALQRKVRAAAAAH